MGVVSLGPTHGIMVLNGIVTMNNSLAKIKYEMTTENKKVRNGEEAVRAEQQSKFKKIGGALACINYCCCCCPCSSLFSRVKKPGYTKLKKL